MAVIPSGGGGGGESLPIQSALTLAVSPTGNDSPSVDRPEFLYGGDYTAFPFLTPQAAVNAIPKFSGYYVRIELAEGAYAGFSFEGHYAGNLVEIVGGRKLAVLASGVTSGFPTATDSKIITMTGAGWTAKNLVGKFVEVLSGPGAGQIAVIAANTADTITLAAGFLPYITVASSFRLVEQTVRITGDTLPSFRSKFSNCSGRFKITDIKFESAPSSTCVGVFDCPARIDALRVTAIGGSAYAGFGFYFERVGTANLEQVSIRNCLYGVYLHDVHTVGAAASGATPGMAIDNCYQGFVVSAIGSISQSGIYAANCLSITASLTEVLSGRVLDFFTDKGFYGISIDKSQLTLSNVSIVGATNTAMRIVSMSNIIFSTPFVGTSNGGWGLRMNGVGNNVTLSGSLPTIFGSSGQITVNGIADVTWAALNFTNSYAVDVASGARIYRQ